MQLKVSDLSQADLQVEVKNSINVISTGLSRVQVSGKTHHLDLTVTNASIANTMNLESKTGNITVQNAAKADINVRDSLRIQASDAARVSYQGNPIIQQSSRNASMIIQQ